MFFVHDLSHFCVQYAVCFQQQICEMLVKSCFETLTKYVQKPHIRMSEIILGISFNTDPKLLSMTLVLLIDIFRIVYHNSSVHMRQKCICENNVDTAKFWITQSE